MAEALVTMVLGDHDAAVEALASLLDREYFMPLSVADLRLDPVWDPLRDQPAFRRLLTSRASGET